MSLLGKLFRRRHREGERDLQNRDAQGSSPSDVSSEVARLQEDAAGLREARKRLSELVPVFGPGEFDPNDPLKMEELRRLICKTNGHERLVYRLIFGSVKVLCLRCGIAWYEDCI